MLNALQLTENNWWYWFRLQYKRCPDCIFSIGFSPIGHWRTLKCFLNYLLLSRLVRRGYLCTWSSLCNKLIPNILSNLWVVHFPTFSIALCLPCALLFVVPRCESPTNLVFIFLMVFFLQVTPPFKPQVESETDTRYFDNVFTGESVQLTPPDTNAMETDDDDSPHFEQFSFHGSSQSLSNINASTRSLNSVHSLGLL